jgi:hypothetical protein
MEKHERIDNNANLKWEYSNDKWNLKHTNIFFYLLYSTILITTKSSIKNANLDFIGQLFWLPLCVNLTTTIQGRLFVFILQWRTKKQLLMFHYSFYIPAYKVLPSYLPLYHSFLSLSLLLIFPKGSPFMFMSLKKT